MRKLVLTLAALIAVAAFIQANSKSQDEIVGPMKKTVLQMTANKA